MRDKLGVVKALPVYPDVVARLLKEGCAGAKTINEFADQFIKADPNFNKEEFRKACDWMSIWKDWTSEVNRNTMEQRFGKGL